MFTGIIEEVGRVLSVTGFGDKARLVVRAAVVLAGTKIGDSISIDGVCQTVTALDSPEKGTFSVDTLGESLKKTTLGSLRAGSPVNLERALQPHSRMGGHIVQGHVSAVARISEMRTAGHNVYLSVEIPDVDARYCVREGSIALDGISLTIADLKGTIATMNLIPATLKATSLGAKKPGDLMNLETDIIGRYVEKLLGQKPAGLTFERLRDLGYTGGAAGVGLA
ncbi:MAG: riboflavin synthase [Spirochaetaceae bacterium]|jgi:riboflavin synthase|nr:riboflavin synthase [Spirochaetaceae bacterium]